MNILASCPVAEFHHEIAMAAIIDFIPSTSEKA